MVHQLVQVNQKQHTAALGAVDLVQARLHQRGDGFWCQVGRKLLLEVGLVGEGEFLRIGLQEKIKRVVDRHVDHQVHCDLELFGFVREHQARLVI